jgi:hypothetical protein
MAPGRFRAAQTRTDHLISFRCLLPARANFGYINGPIRPASSTSRVYCGNRAARGELGISPNRSLIRTARWTDIAAGFASANVDAGLPALAGSSTAPPMRAHLPERKSLAQRRRTP